MRKFCLRVLSIILVLASSVSVFSGCGGNENNDMLTIWAGSYWGGDNLELLQEMVDNYNEYAEANSKRQAKVEILQDMTGTITTSMISGRISDIILWDRFETVRYSHQNLFEPLDNYFQASGHSVNDFTESAMSEFLYNGKHYGVPLDLDAWGYFVNRKAYIEWADSVDTSKAEFSWLLKGGTSTTTVGEDNSKYNYPSTWDEFYQAGYGCTQRNASGDITRAGISSDIQFNAWVATAGGSVVDIEKNKVMYASDEVIPGGGKTYKEATVEVLNFWDKLLVQETDTAAERAEAVTSFSFFSSVGNVDPFLSGKVVFKFNSLLNGIANYNKFKASTFEYDFIGYPKGPDSNGKNPGQYSSGMLGGFGFVIPQQAKNKSDAWDLIEWWTLDDANCAEWTRISKLIPSKKTVQATMAADEDLKKTAPYFSRIIADIDGYIVRPPLINYAIFEGSVLEPEKEGYLRRNANTGKQSPTVADYQNNFLKKMQNSSDLSIFN